MVLRRDHKILHTRIGRSLRPDFRIVQVRIEMLEIAALVFLCRNMLNVHDPLVAGSARIKPPVDEHAEPGFRKPFGPVARWILLLHG